MFIYVVILLTIHLICLGYSFSRDGEAVLNQLGALTLYLPVYGRILGW